MNLIEEEITLLTKAKQQLTIDIKFLENQTIFAKSTKIYQNSVKDLQMINHTLEIKTAIFHQLLQMPMKEKPIFNYNFLSKEAKVAKETKT